MVVSAKTNASSAVIDTVTITLVSACRGNRFRRSENRHRSDVHVHILTELVEPENRTMRYSVYDYTRRAYDYYDAPGPGGTHAGAPPKARPFGDIGAPPSRAAWRLPLGAKKVGSGQMPQGRIASLDGADSSWSLTDAIAYAVLAYVGWRIIR